MPGRRARLEECDNGGRQHNIQMSMLCVGLGYRDSHAQFMPGKRARLEGCDNGGGQHGVQVILVRDNQRVCAAILDLQAGDVQAVGVACARVPNRLPTLVLSCHRLEQSKKA